MNRICLFLERCFVLITRSFTGLCGNSSDLLTDDLVLASPRGCDDGCSCDYTVGFLCANFEINKLLQKKEPVSSIQDRYPRRHSTSQPPCPPWGLGLDLRGRVKVKGQPKAFLFAAEPPSPAKSERVSTLTSVTRLVCVWLSVAMTTVHPVRLLAVVSPIYPL